MDIVGNKWDEVMKSKLKLSKVAIFALMILVFTLTSCSILMTGEPIVNNAESCQHSWDEAEVINLPLCGTKERGIRRYTCKYCGEINETEIFPYTEHIVECVTLLEAGCETDGISAEKCKNCEYSNEYVTPKLEHDYRLTKIPNGNGECGIMCKNCLDVKKYVSVIKYEDYGAIGDGKTDDSEAIRAAHDAANSCGLPVEGKAGATYYIGALDKTIVIKTDTDWNGAEFIFDDHQIRWDDSVRRYINVFTVKSDVSHKFIDVPSGFTLSKGQTNIGMTFDAPCMLKLENSKEKIYKRYGENANGGVNVSEMILVDENGNVDPTTPIQYDYSTVTSITRYSISDKPITVGNATITTIAPNPKEYDPDYENNYCYYARGIMVNRSNTTVYAIKHIVENEDMTIEIDRNGDGVIDKWGADKSYGVPYIGFFSFQICNNATMIDCLVEGHQAYSFYQGATRNEPGTTRNEMGSYDINATDCINLSFRNIVQYENQETGETITNRFMYHGIMGSNFCRNVLMDNCYVDRFDSHQGLHNATITNCTIGFGILVIGGGELYIENVYRLSGGTFVCLRLDYNSVFEGDVVIKNCKMGSAVNSIINGTWRSFYNGLPNYITRSLTIDGLAVEGNDNIYLYNVSNSPVSALTDEVNKLYIPDSVKVSGVSGVNGEEITVKASKYDGDAFSKIEIVRE